MEAIQRAARHIGWISAVSSALCFLGGCRTDPNQCQTDASCFAGETCIQNVCVLMATTPDSGVVLPPPPDMGKSVDMPTPSGCKSDQDCEEGLSCDLSVSECVKAPTGPSCDLETSCEEAGQICEAGRCQKGPCTRDEQCGLARTCTLDGVCEQVEWEFSFYEEETRQVPAALEMQLSSQESGRWRYDSQTLVAQSNTWAKLKSSLELFAGSNELEVYFQACQFSFSLRRPDGEVLMDSSEGARLVSANQIVWRGAQATIQSVEERFALHAELDCAEGNDVNPPFEQLSDESVISLDFSRQPGEVGRGYPVRIRFEPMVP